jgi:hypothetical protein
MVVVRRLRCEFLRAPIVSGIAQFDANANRLSGDSRDSVRDQVDRKLIQRRNPKKFFVPILHPFRRDSAIASSACARRRIHRARLVAHAPHVQESRILQGFLASSNNRRGNRAPREIVRGA